MIAPRWWPSIAVLAPALALVALLVPGRAGADGPSASGLPAPLDATGGLAVDGAELEAPGGVATRLDVELRERPLRPPAASGLAEPIRREVMARVGLHLGILPWLSAGVVVPVGWSDYAAEPTAPPQVGAGDVRVHLKAALLRGPRVRLAAFLALVAPTGDPAAFRSDGAWGGEPRLALDLAAWRFTFSLVAGARLRGTTAGDSGAAGAPLVTVGPELTWGAAARLRAHDMVSLAVEGAGSEALSPFGEAARRTLALLGSIRLRPSPAWEVFAGAGRSLDVGGAAVRGDDLRVVAGVTWRPRAGAATAAGARGGGGGPLEGAGGAGSAPDGDGDGIPDARDRCPGETEDLDGHEDGDGCVDPDNDGDGVPDVSPAGGAATVLDVCPDEAEDRDGFDDEDGCPDPDNDGDGLPDARDRCPGEPETDNGWLDDDGCPDEKPAATSDVAPAGGAAGADEPAPAPRRRRGGGR